MITSVGALAIPQPGQPLGRNPERPRAKVHARGPDLA
jgi:hypothetical protein